MSYVLLALIVLVVISIFSKKNDGRKPSEKSSASSSLPSILYFKGNEEALEYACAYLDCSNRKGGLGIVQFVVPSDNVGEASGYLVRMATSDGILPVPVVKHPQLKIKISVGDLVWIGIDAELYLVVKKLSPSFSLEESRWLDAEVVV